MLFRCKTLESRLNRGQDCEDVCRRLSLKEGDFKLHNQFMLEVGFVLLFSEPFWVVGHSLLGSNFQDKDYR